MVACRFCIFCCGAAGFGELGTSSPGFRAATENAKNFDLNYLISRASLLILFLINLQPLVPTNNFFGNWINIYYFMPLGFYLHLVISESGLYKPVYSKMVASGGLEPPRE